MFAYLVDTKQQGSKVKTQELILPKPLEG